MGRTRSMARENAAGKPPMAFETADNVVEFIPENGGGAGVRLRERKA